MNSKPSIFPLPKDACVQYLSSDHKLSLGTNPLSCLPAGGVVSSFPWPGPHPYPSPHPLPPQGLSQWQSVVRCHNTLARRTASRVV
jgi:hypothetical protein